MTARKLKAWRNRSRAGIPRSTIEASVQSASSLANWLSFRFDLFAHLTMAVALGDLEGNIIACNPAFGQLVGRECEALIGKPWDDLTHPDDLARGRALLATHRAGSQQDLSLEKRYVRPDGSLVWAQLSFVPIARDGQRVATMTFAQDITSTVIANANANAASSRLDKALRLSTEGFWEWNLVTEDMYVSPAWREITGWPQEGPPPDAVAWQAMLYPEDAEKVGHALAATMAGPIDPFSLEYRIRTKRGIRRVLDHGRVLARGSDGRAQMMVGCITDVTSLREAQDALQQAQKMESLGRLAGGIAHDFNNLLTTIAGNTALAMREATDRQHAFLMQIDRAVESAAALTGRLLAFCRKQLLEPRPVRLPDLVRRLEGLLARLIGSHVTLDVRIKGGEQAVQVDPGQAEQAIINLVLNARDAMPDGGSVVLTIEDSQIVPNPSAWPSAKLGPYVAITVSDTGTGLSERARNHLFEPFFTTKDHGMGTGLGLSTVYGVVEQHGGFIEVESEIGKGTSFKLMFPHAPNNDSVAPPRPTEWVRGHEHVVLVEDDQLVRGVIKSCLEELGYRVTEFASADAYMREAAALSQASLIITDVMMPGMRGNELVKLIRQRDPDMPVLYLSGYTDNQDLGGDDDTAPTEFLAKPFSPPDLARKLRRLLDMRKAAAIEP
jgi:PAS domain S-box-containing protein